MIDAPQDRDPESWSQPGRTDPIEAAPDRLAYELRTANLIEFFRLLPTGTQPRDTVRERLWAVLRQRLGIDE